LKCLRILFLVDGNFKIGMGHVYRSLNLASALRLYSHKISFLTSDLIAKKMISELFSCKYINTKNCNNKKEIIEKINPDIIIIDKLFEKRKILQMLQKITKKIIGIDYKGRNKDLINYGINMLYPLSGKKNNSYSGLGFAILNSQFSEKRIKKIKKNPTSVLILQGGSDTRSFIPVILNSLKNLPSSIKISVVLGPSFRSWSQLKKSINENERDVTILQNVKDMRKIMRKHDIAITGGGMTLLELSCVGVPSIVVCGEQFENETAKLLQKNGFGINLGFNPNLSKKKIFYATKKLLADFELRKNMSNSGKKLVDGKGANRVAKIITNLGGKK